MFFRVVKYPRRGLYCENCRITDHSLLQVKFNTDVLLEICLTFEATATE